MEKKLLNFHLDRIKDGHSFIVLTENQIKELETPLPKEALTTQTTGAKLTSIRSGFVTDKFNKVFGVGKWITNQIVIHEPKFVEAASSSGGTRQKPVNDAVLYVEFYASEYGIYQSSFGGSANAQGDYGDSYKGAYSDAMSKILSLISSGVNKIWKNEKDEVKKDEAPKKEFLNYPIKTDKDKTFIEAIKLKIASKEFKSVDDLSAFYIMNTGTKEELKKLFI